MKNMISKFFNKECKVDLDLLVELKCRGYLTECFYQYLVIDKGIEEIWISEKDNKFLVEFREENCCINCRKEIDDTINNREKTFNERLNYITSSEELKEIYKERVKSLDTKSDMKNILNKKEVLRSVTLNSEKELLKFLSK